MNEDKEFQVTADLFVLGANAIQSPAIVLRSDLDGEWVGRGLHEGFGWNFEAYLDGIDNFDGSTITTGLNFGLYDGPHRSDYAAALVYFENQWSYGMRPEPGRLRQTLPLRVVTEDLLKPENHVTLDENENAHVVYAGAFRLCRGGHGAGQAAGSVSCFGHCRCRRYSTEGNRKPNRMFKGRCEWAGMSRILSSTGT
ncbi:hypothetical protein NKL07_01655 [Mesorhizobium sp. C280B]